MAVAHYLEALDWQREFIKHPRRSSAARTRTSRASSSAAWRRRSIPTSQASLNAGTIAELQRADREGARLRHARLHPGPAGRRLVLQGLGRLRRRASATTWSTASIRRTTGRTRTLFLPSGRHPQARPLEGRAVRPGEDHRVGHALLVRLRRRRRQGAPSLRRARRSRSTPGPKPPYERLDTDAKYSWLKSPRYDGEPMEVGPLARMLVAYASGHPRVKELVGARPAASSASGPRRSSRRSAASPRAASRRRSSPRRWTTGSTSSPPTWRAATSASTTTRSGTRRPGRRSARAPASTRRRAARSATGSTSRTARSPTTSASSRAPGTPGRATRQGNRGPYEEALLGTPVADPTQPLEILRTVHSFDPCMACGVHVVDAQRRELAHVRVAMSAAGATSRLDPPAEDLVRVYVWEWPVRADALAHRPLDRRPLGDRASTSATRS